MRWWVGQERAVGAGKESNDDTLRESSYVMAQVAFLCQSISPDLANKATQAAMTVLLKVRHIKYPANPSRYSRKV
jgi:hypothetical protein